MPIATFRTFPAFSKLTIKDREYYEGLVAGYPPISDINFTTLMLWWNFLDTCAVATLNGNVVISYWLPGGEDKSGLSILGTHNIDESICAIFDSLKERGEPPRLVHVPEFVMAHMRYPELFCFTQEPDFDEYIIPISSLYPLKSVLPHRRKKIRRFLQENEDRVLVKSLDLAELDSQRLLLDCAEEWWQAGTLNGFMQLEDEVLPTAIKKAEELDIQNVCLYLDNQLLGFVLYRITDNKEYAILYHDRVDTSIPYSLEYLHYALGERFAEQGIHFINHECDLGLPLLRTFKLSLGPSQSFKKYTVSPRKAG